MTKASNYPFHPWVPRWLGVIIHLLLFVPTFFVCGAYTANSSEMTSSLGIISEHIQYASFATAAGMAVFTPFVVRYLIMRRPKMSYLFCFSGMFVLSLVCAVTDSMPLLILCSFFMGVFRIMLIFNTIFSLMQYLTHINPVDNYNPKTEPTDHAVIDKLDYLKTFVMIFLYMYFLSLSQLCSSFTAWLAHEYEWQYAYYGMMGLILLTLIVVQATMQYQKSHFRKDEIRFNRIGDFVAVSLFLLGICYILIYGKTLDWFDDWTVWVALNVVLVSAGAFVLLQANTSKPYLRLDVFRRKYTLIAITVFILLMVVNSHSSLISAYTGISMSIDNLQSAELNNYGVIGYVIGAALCLVMFKLGCHIRYIFATGFLCIGVSAVYLYFYFQTEGLYADLIFPTVIRCVGMDMLYSMGAIYGMKRLRASLFPSWVFVMLAFRSVIAPVTGAAAYSNLIYHRSEQHLSSMLEYADASNPDFSSDYNKTFTAGRFSGKSYGEAVQMASTSAKGKIQKQAMLLTLKEISGWTIYACLGCALIVLFVSYPPKEWVTSQ